MSNNQNKKNNIGFIGLGAIGLPIAQNLINSGYKLKLHSKSIKEKHRLKLKDSKTFRKASNASKNVKIIMICVTDDDAVEDVLFGKNGAIKTLVRGCIVIDLSTISPKAAISNYKRLKSYGIDYLDAPVTGGTEGAKSGKLTIFVGGDKRVLKKVYSILEVIGNNIYHFGKTGTGQKVKAINQVLVAGSYMAVAEAIALGLELKLPMKGVVKSLKSGAANSWALENRSNNMINNHYPLGFKVSLHNKDLKIALKLAKEKGICLPITKKVQSIEEDLMGTKYKDQDISSIKEWITTQKF